MKEIISNFKLNMKQCSKFENTCDIFMIERRMEDEPLQEHEENVTVQITRNRNLENIEEKM
jgi:hypothetical protein